jgi:hypothetical protein
LDGGGEDKGVSVPESMSARAVRERLGSSSDGTKRIAASAGVNAMDVSGAVSPAGDEGSKEWRVTVLAKGEGPECARCGEMDWDGREECDWDSSERRGFDSVSVRSSMTRSIWSASNKSCTICKQRCT